jgi:hypothetical protein
MLDKARVSELVARLAAASEGSEQLDVSIARLVCGYGPDDPLWHILFYSRIWEAARTLIPEGFHYMRLAKFPDGWSALIAPHHLTSVRVRIERMRNRGYRPHQRMPFGQERVTLSRLRKT